MSSEQPHRQQQQQYPYNPYEQKQQEAPGYVNRNDHSTPQPIAAEYAAWSNAKLEQPLPQWYKPPSGQAYDGIERAHNWVTDQLPLTASPPPTAKTPFSEYGSTVGGATVGSYPFYSASPAQPESTPRKPNDRICGVKTNVFFIVLALGAFVLVAGIATGLAVGLALGKKSANTAAAPAETRQVGYFMLCASSSLTSTTTTQTTSTSATSTRVSPTPAFTGTITLGPVSCPRDNSSVYISQITSKPFNIECGHDYNSQGGAKDLSHQATTTFADCINLCGSKSSCVGVGWGIYQSIPTCWLKSALGAPNNSTSWYFARLQSLDQNNSTVDTRQWNDEDSSPSFDQ
ncbi:hypothetical protein BKA67DRAFT_535559 [Truncatella angustata]|uniref:Apple domain-containing protein n=1 Tax=Truncatella angustata TaxID=152316 RepID=A0A9P8ZXK8_9PEZI|nr:uncharacterized protein BKA67DRAFT_535559 [Truncatella angustata]KAH6654228.1 hypothetical protein BKA67DRAFT_535559 [Truncatella angustata]